MKLTVFRHLWGVTDAPASAFPRFKAAGYGGIEGAVPPPAQRRQFRRLLDEYGFDYIPQIFTQGNTVAEHLASFRAQVRSAAAMRPRLINAHSGRDGFSEADSLRFFEGALAIEREAGVAVAHETHRGRVLYNPWVTERLLARFTDLKLCCDFSHWVCVCERLLEGELGIIRQCAERCLHLHARVGYEEGPQVPDPRAPEYQRHVEAHERWWQLVWRAQARRGVKHSSMTPEFGPPQYLHTLPFTQAPVSPLEEICDWQARRLGGLFQRAARGVRAAS
jgi:sugar phosphate isomerase/epimerase